MSRGPSIPRTPLRPGRARPGLPAGRSPHRSPCVPSAGRAASSRGQLGRGAGPSLPSSSPPRCQGSGARQLGEMCLTSPRLVSPCPGLHTRRIISNTRIHLSLPSSGQRSAAAAGSEGPSPLCPRARCRLRGTPRHRPVPPLALSLTSAAARPGQSRASSSTGARRPGQPPPAIPPSALPARRPRALRLCPPPTFPWVLA